MSVPSMSTSTHLDIQNVPACVGTLCSTLEPVPIHADHRSVETGIRYGTSTGRSALHKRLPSPKWARTSSIGTPLPLLCCKPSLARLRLMNHKPANGIFSSAYDQDIEKIGSAISHSQQFRPNLRLRMSHLRLTAAKTLASSRYTHRGSIRPPSRPAQLASFVQNPGGWLCSCKTYSRSREHPGKVPQFCVTLGPLILRHTT